MGVDELDALYFHGSVREVAKAVAAFTTAYDLTKREMYEKVLGDFRNGEIPDINRDLYEAYSKNLRKAVNDVLQSGSYGDRYFDMQMQFEANVSRFAAYKAYQATKELSELDPGQLDTVGRAKLNKYNRWQATEYNTAMARARTARQFTDFTSDPKAKILYPNLKWLPSRSAHPREEHEVFWNRVWAKDDPFWDENTPGSLWNCKCDWRETDEPVTSGNPGGRISHRGLEGNPAKTGEVFTDECPYISNLSNRQKQNIESYFFDKIIRRDSLDKLHQLQGGNVAITKLGNSIDVIFDSKTTTHLANDIVTKKEFLWNELIDNIPNLLKNSILVAHEPNTKLDKKPSAVEYFYYEYRIGDKKVYFNIEENLIVREQRHFYRLYALTDKLREGVTRY